MLDDYLSINKLDKLVSTNIYINLIIVLLNMLKLYIYFLLLNEVVNSAFNSPCLYVHQIFENISVARNY